MSDTHSPVTTSPTTAKASISWTVFLAGKPGFDYSTIDVRAIPLMLNWKFAELSNEEIIGTCGRLAKQIASTEKWLEAAKEILKERLLKDRTINVGSGLEFSGSMQIAATLSKRERTGIDTERLKADFGDAWYASYCKTTEYYEIRWKEIKV